MPDTSTAAGATGAAATATAGAGADAGTTLLDPSNDNTTAGGAGGAGSNAGADAAATAAKAGDQDPTKSKPGDSKAPADQPKGAPEKYTDYKLPEGVTLDPEVTGKFNTVAKELNLTQEQAQKLVTLQSEISLKTVEQSLKAFNDMKLSWEAETKKQLGAKFDAERAFAAKGRDWVKDPELVKVLNESGFGSHPALFKLFARLGRAVSEDGLTEGKSATSGEETTKSTAEVLFGKTSPKN